MHTGAVIEGKLVYLGDTVEQAPLDPLLMNKIGEED
jgi:hypothetical protein